MIRKGQPYEMLLDIQKDIELILEQTTSLLELKPIVESMDNHLTNIENDIEEILVGQKSFQYGS